MNSRKKSYLFFFFCFDSRRCLDSLDICLFSIFSSIYLWQDFAWTSCQTDENCIWGIFAWFKDILRVDVLLLFGSKSSDLKWLIFFLIISSLTTISFYFALEFVSLRNWHLSWLSRHWNEVKFASQLATNKYLRWKLFSPFVMMLPASAVRRLSQAQLWMWKKYTFGILFFLITKMLPKIDLLMKLTDSEILIFKNNPGFFP